MESRPKYAIPARACPVPVAMPYNRGMNELTLVLPFALPPPLLAPDLLRALQSPDPGSPVASQPLSALAALLTRTTSRQATAFDGGARVLPHEAWLAHALGLAASPAAPEACAPLAAAALLGFGFGFEPGDGAWFIVHPVHLQLARTHLVINDTRPDLVSEADGRALFEAAKPYFEEEGKTLLYGDANTWFVRADDWKDLSTASPDAAAGQNLADWMPVGEKARDSRRLQNEVQMLWHALPTNEAREERGLKPMNSFWLWGGSAAATVSGPPLFSAEGPAWMTALAAPERRAPTAASLLNGADRDAIVVLGTLIEAGLAEDWSTWLMQMQRLEIEWFAPLLAGLKNGHLAKLTLVLSHRDGYVEYTSTKNAQRAFWRKPSLKGLLP